MAIINCPYCGQQISSMAPKCPKCGNITNIAQNQSSVSDDTTQNATKVINKSNELKDTKTNNPKNSYEYAGLISLICWVGIAVGIIILGQCFFGGDDFIGRGVGRRGRTNFLIGILLEIPIWITQLVSCLCWCAVFLGISNYCKKKHNFKSVLFLAIIILQPITYIADLFNDTESYISMWNIIETLLLIASYVITLILGLKIKKLGSINLVAIGLIVSSAAGIALYVLEPVCFKDYGGLVFLVIAISAFEILALYLIKRTFDKMDTDDDSNDLSAVEQTDWHGSDRMISNPCDDGNKSADKISSEAPNVSYNEGIIRSKMLEAEKNGNVQSKQKNSRRNRTWLWIIFGVLAAMVIAGIIWYIMANRNRDYESVESPYYDNNSDGENNSGKSASYDNNHNGSNVIEFPDSGRIKDVVGSYLRAIVENDFETLSNLYAPYVDRYQSAYGETRDEVMQHHYKYDEVFGVYGKHSSVRWETLEFRQISEDCVEACVVEDYSIDRYDNSKVSIFVLKKHFTLNRDYQITSVYDEQLSKAKK